MKYLFAVVLPPVALLMCGKPFQALLNVPLCLMGGVPGIIHALCVVMSHEANQRARYGYVGGRPMPPAPPTNFDRLP